MAVSRIIKAVPVFFFLTASPLLANDSVFSIIGYYKNLFTQSRATDTEESYFVDLNRLRLQLNYKPTETFESVVAVDNEFFAHDAAGIGDFNNVRQKNERYLAAWDADYVSADKRHYYARHSLFRAYMKYSRPNFNVTVGKQGIDWSRMRFYAPLDLFNPVSPLDLERDERVGSDAVNVEYYFNSDTSLNVIAAPAHVSGNSDFGARLFRKFHDYDLFLVAGEFKKDDVVGLGFDGYLFQAGLRGEFSYTNGDSGRHYSRAVLGADYSLNPKLYLLAEHFYNGGADDNDIAAFLSSYRLSRSLLSIKKHLTGLFSSYEITPLFKFDNYLIYDWSGKSLFLNPEFRYNISTNLDASAGVQFFWGSNSSEFGSYQNVYYAQLKYYF